MDYLEGWFMYSYDDRLRAVRLYIRLGKRVALTIRQLGYPTKNARLKTELFYARDWLSTSIEDFVADLDAYIHWYNEVRIKMSLGFRSPIEHRRQLGIAA